MRSLLDRRDAAIDKTGVIFAWLALCCDWRDWCDLCLIGAIRSALCCDRRDRCDLVWSSWCCDRRDWCDLCLIGAVLSALCCDRRYWWDRCDLVQSARSLLAVSLSLSLSLFARLSPKMDCRENRNVKWFPSQSLYFYGQIKCISGNSIFHAQPNTWFYGKWFPKMVWSQNNGPLNYWITIYKPKIQRQILQWRF